MKKLYRSNTNKVFAGVLGGIGEYLEVDPVVVRIIFLILTCFTAFFPGILFYIVALFVIPKKPETIAHDTTKSHQVDSNTSEDEKDSNHQ
jgi:phage shock protein C